MALFLFTEAILQGKPIKVFNAGKMKRDFTYIDDIVEGVFRVMQRPAEGNPSWNGDAPDPGTARAPYRIYNIGNNRPTELSDFIMAIENALGMEARRELLPMQPGDVSETFADIDDLSADFGFRPATSLKTGIERFIAWYREYYGA